MNNNKKFIYKLALSVIHLAFVVSFFYNESASACGHAGRELRVLTRSPFLYGRIVTIAHPHYASTFYQRTFSTTGSDKQVYGIPTYDALFKYVLDSNTVRPSFFNAMLPDLHIISSERIDEHMNPLQELEALRTLINHENTSKVVKTLQKSSEISVHCSMHNKLTKHPQATQFLITLLSYFDDIKKAFPKKLYDGTMDFVCRLENNDCIMVEMQVIPYDYWDRRALAYVAAFYGKQMREGSKWRDIKKVIGINVLGGGKDRLQHWDDRPSEYVRHYKIQEQLHQMTSQRFIDGIEIIQYSLMNTPDDFSNTEQKDWFKFLKDASFMTEAQVNSTITTDAVKEAFNRAKLQALPDRVKELYQREDDEYTHYSIHTKKQVDKGKAEGIEVGKAEGEAKAKREIAFKMLTKKKGDDEILEFSGITPDELEQIKNLRKTECVTHEKD